MVNIAFFGEDHNSQIVLEKLISYCQSSQRYELSMIITTRPKPKGKNGSLELNPIEKLANKHKIKVLYYSSKDKELSKIINNIKNSNIDFAVLSSFGHILPNSILSAFPRGIINIHPSLLPQYRGATPVQHAIALGDKTTGVTLFLLDADVDKGTILTQAKHSISDYDTFSSLSKTLFDLGANLLEQVLDNNLKPEIIAKLPDQKLVFTTTFKRQDGYVEWETVQKLLNKEKTVYTKNRLLNLYLVRNGTYEDAFSNLIKALNPWPSVWTQADTKKGPTRIKFVSLEPELMVHLSSKPNPIGWSEFEKYYL